MSTRRARTTVRLCLLPFLVLVFVMGPTAVADALPGPCSILPEPAKSVCKNVVPGGGGLPGLPSLPHVPDPVSTVVNTVGGKVANAVLGPLIQEATKLAATAMTSMLRSIFQTVSNATEPELTSPWFINLFKLLGGFALVIGVGFLIPSIREGTKEGDLGEAATAVAIFGGFVLLLFVLVGAVSAVLWIVDGQMVPYMTNQALGDLNHAMANHKVDFTKDTTLSNNALTPILIPFAGGVIGFIGGFFTLILFEVRNVMIYFMVGAEALAAAMAVGRRWGNDTFVRVTMVLIAWILLRLIMAIILIIAVKMITAPNKSAIFTGAVALATLPVLGWVFVKTLANHRISVLSSTLNARAMWNALPFTT